MRPHKPIYPPPWWAEPAPCDDGKDVFSPGDEFTVCFVGYDCLGNPLFSIKRPLKCQDKCRDKRPACFPTRDYFRN